MGVTFTKPYAMNYYDFDKNYRLKPVSLMNTLQDISTVHFETATAHVSSDILEGVWVIVEWQVVMNQLPVEIEPLILTTEPSYFRKFIAYRNYLIKSPSGEVLGTAISKWAYINKTTRRQVNIPKLLNTLFQVEETVDKPEKIQMDTLESAHTQIYHTKSVYSDIDINNHVNNVAYIRWVMDALGESFHAKHAFKGLKVIYKKEVLIGETMTIHSQIKETEKITVSSHQLYNNQEELCVQLSFEWQNI